MSYLTVGRESRAAPGRKFNPTDFHLGVEQFDRGDVLMGWGSGLSAFKIAPAMGAGVTDLVEMLEAFGASPTTRRLKRPLRAA